MSQEGETKGGLQSGKKKDLSMRRSSGLIHSRADDFFDFNSQPYVPEPESTITNPETLNNNFTVSLTPKDSWIKLLSKIYENPIKYKAIPETVGTTVSLNDYTGLVMGIRPPLAFYDEGRLIEHPMKLSLELKGVSSKKSVNERQEDINRQYLLDCLPEQVAHHLSTRK